MGQGRVQANCRSRVTCCPSRQQAEQQAATHLTMVAVDGVRMAAMLIKRVDFNWATAGSNLYSVSECGPGLQQCPPVYRRP